MESKALLLLATNSKNDFEKIAAENQVLKQTLDAQKQMINEYSTIIFQ